MDGILPIWKERGWTSNDVVVKARRILGTRRIGHTGTLDPEVEGVLVLCVGDATRLVQYMVASDKEYAGQITLGIATETEDQTGEIVEQTPVDPPVTSSVVDQAMERLTGEITQVPPYYSAVKVQGRRLYEYARLGLQVERPQRQVEVYRFERTSQPLYDSENRTQSWDFEVACSKGTYVRTLAVDTGRHLGYPSHMSQLIRTANNGFTKEDCVTLEALQNLMDQDPSLLEEVLQPMKEGLRDFPQIEIDQDHLFQVIHGQVVPQDFFGCPVTQPVAIFYEDTALALYDVHPSKPDLLKPLRVFQSARRWMASSSE